MYTGGSVSAAAAGYRPESNVYGWPDPVNGLRSLTRVPVIEIEL